jgi:hypothetical protein
MSKPCFQPSHSTGNTWSASERLTTQSQATMAAVGVMMVIGTVVSLV